jgi:hypothetical protein
MSDPEKFDAIVIGGGKGGKTLAMYLGKQNYKAAWSNATRFRTPKGKQEWTGSHLLVALGRAPITKDLDLPAAGVETTSYGNSKPRTAIANAGVVNLAGRLLYWLHMNAQVCTAGTSTVTNEVTNETIPDWLLLPGFLMSASGIILVALGKWTLLNGTTQTLLLLCGGMLCFFGIVVIPSWLIYQMKAASGAHPTETSNWAI